MLHAISSYFYRTGWHINVLAVVILLGAAPAVFAVGRVGSMPSAKSQAASQMVLEKNIRESILDLTAGELRAERAADSLRAKPRAAVLAILRDDLRAEPVRPWHGVLRAAQVIDAREILPELKASLAVTDDYAVWLCANRLLLSSDSATQRDFAEFYLQRLASLVSSTAKIVAIEGLSQVHRALDPISFERHSQSDDFQVRIAAVRNFLQTRASLMPEEQIKRFREAFALHPYQARLAALSAFLMLPKLERARLKAALSSQICRNEQQPAVLKICRSIASDGAR